MRVVINALQYKPDSSGIGVMIRELFGTFACRTERECRVILTQDNSGFPAGSGTEIIRAPFEHSAGIKRMLFQTFLMGPGYCKDALLLTTDSKTPFILPKSCCLVPLVTDLAVFRMPEVYERSRVLLWRLQYKYVCRRAEMFLAISEFTKREMVEILQIPPERIKVVPMACSERMHRVEDESTIADLRIRYSLPEHFILFVGNNNPRKNLERTIRAFNLMKEKTGLPHRLVIAGERGWRFDRTAVLNGVRHSDDVVFTGFVPDEDMPALYSAADLFIFSTLYEGFGIPVLEAQSCGTPVVTSNISALPEVAGNSAELVNPYDIESICGGMIRILTDESYAKELIKSGVKNAGCFSWKRSAGVLNETVEEIIRWISEKNMSAGSGMRRMRVSPKSSAK